MRRPSGASYDHPVQSFVWVDFTAKDGRRSTYWFYPLMGAPKIVDRSATPIEITVETEALFTKGEHDIFFNRGMYKIWFARNYRTDTANTLLLDNALATIGAGLPSGIAAKLINPDRGVFLVCGDGGFMMNSQELETAVRLRLELVVLIIKDRAYGMIRWKQAVDHFDDFGMTFNNPDFVAYANSYGAPGHRINEVAQLEPTLEASFAEGGVHIVAVPIDYSENTRVLVEELGGRTTDVRPA